MYAKKMFLKGDGLYKICIVKVLNLNQVTEQEQRINVYAVNSRNYNK